MPPLATLLLAIGISCGGAGLLAFVFYRLVLVRRLRQLARAAQRIGLGDLQSPLLELGGGAELSALAASFEEMRQRLLDAATSARRRVADAEILLAGMVEGVFAVDRERRLTYLSPQAATLLGTSSEAALGRFCGDVLLPRLPGGGRPCESSCPLVHARSRGASRATEHLGAVGRTVVLRCAAPQAERQVVVLREESDLEAGRRVRDAVFAHVSHELKTPLAGQLASIEMLLDGEQALAPPARRQLLESLQRSTLRFERLIDNLLESVRIEKDPFDLPREALNLHGVLAEAIEGVAPLLAQKEQPLVLRLPERLPAVLGDSDSLAQVFVNLLANASKFAPEGTTIRLGGELRGEQVAAWVEDEGPGLGAGDPGTVFQRFRRAGEVEPEAPGLGLGLWIVRSIIERHGGEVGMERTPAGRTRFFFVLPAGERA